MPRTIPQIRERMHELAEELGCDELHELADETRRRSPVRRAAHRLPRLTTDLKLKIIEAARAFPEASYKELSEALNTSIGRVSEALAGKR
jgi:hypothetical protein